VSTTNTPYGSSIHIRRAFRQGCGAAGVPAGSAAVLTEHRPGNVRRGVTVTGRIGAAVTPTRLPGTSASRKGRVDGSEEGSRWPRIRLRLALLGQARIEAGGAALQDDTRRAIGFCSWFLPLDYRSAERPEARPYFLDTKGPSDDRCNCSGMASVTTDPTVEYTTVGLRPRNQGVEGRSRRPRARGQCQRCSLGNRCSIP
jgi:hypothetical protein